MPTDSTPQIDKEDSESVQQVGSLITLIAKAMVDRDLRSKEAIEEANGNGEHNSKTQNQSNKI